jgi:hypothetical protein
VPLHGKANHYALEKTKYPVKVLHRSLRQSAGAVAQLSHCEFNLITVDGANGTAEFTSYQGIFR